VPGKYRPSITFIEPFLTAEKGTSMLWISHKKYIM